MRILLAFQVVGGRGLSFWRRHPEQGEVRDEEADRDRCRTAGARRVNRSYGIALGPGPAYPVPFRQAILHYDHGRSAGGWIYVKVLWIVSARYRGPVLVRGHELDGTNWLGFAGGARPLEELQLPPARAGTATGWRAFPSYTRVRAGSGCYAYQIDGTSFSKVVVFRLEP
jgi:hypothetical protein